MFDVVCHEEEIMSVAAPKRKAEDRSLVVEFGPLVVDARSMVATLNGKLLPLSKAELKILARLAVAAPQPLSLLELYRFYTGRESAGIADASLNLRQHIMRLRRRLAEAGDQVEIETVRGVGYYLVQKEPKEKQAPGLSVVVISDDPRLLNSKILPTCRKIRASRVRKYGGPREVLADLESDSFPQTDLILTAVRFPFLPADVGTDHDVFSMVQRLVERGIDAPIIALDAFDFCRPRDLAKLKELGVIVERTNLNTEKKTVFQLYANIQRILDSQA